MYGTCFSPLSMKQEMEAMGFAGEFVAQLVCFFMY